jgi:alkane 1-monooxygenase
MMTFRPIPDLVAAAFPADPAERAMRGFALATLGPAALIAVGAVAGGWLAWAALVSMTVVVAVLDRIIARAAPLIPGMQEFPAADLLSRLLAAAHLALLPVVLWAVAGDSGLGTAERVGLLLGAGLWFGQISNANAHELIHRRDRARARVGAALYVTLLFGHHASAHRLVHHRHVATEDDPNTARRGEAFWSFLPRAWAGSFAAGRDYETLLRERARADQWMTPRLHPYTIYLAGSAAAATLVTAALGLAGLAAYLLLCGFAQMQLLLSDYVQHYGLERARLPGGRHAPPGPRHSWNAAHRASGAMLLNAPRHSAHHAHPARAFPALDLPDDAPRLPSSLPVMAAAALVPPLWFRIMDPRLDRMRDAGPTAR